MSKAKSAHVVLIEGKALEKKAKGALVPPTDRTNYDRLDRIRRARKSPAFTPA